MKDMSKILEDGKAVIIPMDHGVSEGPIEGLVDMNETVKKIADGGASAVLLHKGIIKNLVERPKCGLICIFQQEQSLQRIQTEKSWWVLLKRQ